MTKNNLMNGIISTLAGATLWGFSGACGEFLTGNGMTASYVTPLRLTTAGLILIVFAFLTQKSKLIELFKNPKDIAVAALFGLLGVFPSQFFYLATIEHSNAGTATVLQYTGPAMIIVYMCIRFRRMPKLIEIVSLLLAMGGVFIIATHGNPTSLAISSKTLVYGMLAALALVFYTLIPESITPKYGSAIVTGMGMLCAACFTMPLIHPWTVEASWSYGNFGAFMGMVILGTVFAYTLYVRGVGIIGSSKASMISCVEPVSAALFSALWFGTVFSTADYIGFAMILTTVILLGKTK